MRAILVGSVDDRERLRAQLNGQSIDIVAEFLTPLEARMSAVDADAIISSPRASRAVQPLEPLTPRETQVLELLAEGLSNKAIARQLGISDQTVKFHVSSISGKLGAANRTDAVRRAVKRGLIAL
jgi:DNA-binding NarL/FixJ family response regulator